MVTAGCSCSGSRSNARRSLDSATDDPVSFRADWDSSGSTVQPPVATSELENPVRIALLGLCALAFSTAGCAIATSSGSAPPPVITSMTLPPSIGPSQGSASQPASPCIDTSQFADNAESVMGSIQGVVTALKAANADQARTSAATASSGLKKLADSVDPAQPEAAKDFRTAATELDSAATQFPGGLSTVEQAQTDVNNGLLLARAAQCP